MASITPLRMIYLSYNVWIFEQEYSEIVVVSRKQIAISER